MAGVTFKSVGKVYENNKGGVRAVNDFNLKIEDKEFVILVGPSGCGKTTTLRMVAGLEEITEGEIYIGNKLVNDVQPKDRDIAMVFQNYALYPHMTVFDNMAFGLKLRKTPKEEIRRKVARAAEILEIEHLLDRKPKALSGGQRQRVALGRAIVREPKVFLMDEPLSNLDAKLRSQMRVEITKLHQSLKTTIIYVTHDQTEAMTMGTRIVVMKDGLMQQVDAPQVLYEKPKNQFVGGFIGSPPMNFVKAKIIAEGNDVFFQIIDVKDKKVKDMIKRVEIERNLKVPEGRSKEMLESDYIGKDVILGIRPEHIHDEPSILEQLKDSVVPAKIEVTEMLGAETFLYATVGKEINITARVNPRTKARPGQEMELAIDTNRTHVFDKETEEIVFLGS